MPIPLDDKTYNFSFSGLKSAVINLKHNEEQRGNTININDLATSFQNRVVDILVKKTIRALKEYKVNNLIIAGGVAANNGLRERLTEESKKLGFSLVLPLKKNCTDNAAMIGSASYYAYKLGKTSNLNFSAKANDELC